MTSAFKNTDSFAELDHQAQTGNWRIGWADSFCDIEDEFIDQAEVDRTIALVQNLTDDDWNRLKSVLPERSVIWGIRMFEAFIWADSIEGMTTMIPRLCESLLLPDYESTYVGILFNIEQALKIIPRSHPALVIDANIIKQLKQNEQRYVGYKKAISDLCKRCVI